MSNLLGTFDNLAEVNAAFPSGGVDGDYVIVVGVNYYWDSYLRNWFTEQQAITIPSNTIQETNDLGVFTSIEAVKIAFPNGGQEGDYLFIDGNRYHWNKWEKIWETSAEVVVAPPNYYVNDLGTFTTMDEVWELYPDGRDIGDFLTIDSIKYYWDEYNQCWNSETGVAPFLELLDKTNKGNFATIDAVFSSLPNGGEEGDYLFIDSIKYRWNKYIAVWVGVDNEPAGSHATNNINGDLYVQKDLVVGGNLRVKGLISKYDRLYQLLLKVETEHESSIASEINAFKTSVNNALANSQTGSSSTAGNVKEQLLQELASLKEQIEREYLRKDVQDTAIEEITFNKGLTSTGLAKLFAGLQLNNNHSINADGEAILKSAILDVLKSDDFRQGLIDGAGFGLFKEANGTSVLEVDKLVVRLKMLISELEVRKFSYVGNDQVFSSAGSHITRATTLDSGDFRCYMLADDGTTRTLNNWRIGDQAKCKTNNIQQGLYENVSDRYYWRLVVARGTETLEDNKLYNYVDLSNTYGSLDVIGEDGKTHLCVGYDTSVENDVPAAEDDIVQLGNQIDTERQYAYIIYVSEHKRVDYAGIKNFDLASREVEKHSADGGFIKSDRFEIRSSSGTGVSSPIVCDRGGWIDGMVCGHYDRVSYNGALWLCNVGEGQTTTEEPSLESSIWIPQIEKGENAKLLSISVSSNVMRCNADFSSIPGQQITIEAKVSNIEGNVLFTAIPYDDNDAELFPITLSGTGNTRTLSDSDWITTYSKVKLIVQLGDYSDSIAVYRFVSTNTEEDYSVGGKNLLREFETQFDFNYWGGNGQRGTSEIDIYSIVLPIKYIIGSDIIPVDENGRGIEL